MFWEQLRRDRAAKNSGEERMDLTGLDTAERIGWRCLGMRAKMFKPMSFGRGGMRTSDGGSVVVDMGEIKAVSALGGFYLCNLYS
ncbi:hypothetical protein TorRG33x02_185450 [Trema orientale]|uniref:Uncharacterized protein n=1 Tax=Trema orientale TaxID=63057 RepID=A0A2P5EJI5_TREOI|nr:hypothetical protein TorRG33x02_185450 [Trema orientale]